MEQVGQRLRFLREKAHLTQAKIAELLGSDAPFPAEISTAVLPVLSCTSWLRHLCAATIIGLVFHPDSI